MGVEQVATQGVQGFALVELAGDLAPIARVRQILRGKIVLPEPGIPDRVLAKAIVVEALSQGALLPTCGRH